eukprot:2589348-Pleurochrysis_carterae.AAC.1
MEVQGGSRRGPRHKRPWRDKLGNDVRRKLEKQKQATANLIFKVSPTPLQVFSGLHNYLCELQPKNKGKHITVLKQLAGQRGGELVHHSFEILSGEMVAVFFKSTIVFGIQQGSVHFRDDGTVMAVIAPMTFHLKQKMPGHLNEPVMSVVVDTAALACRLTASFASMRNPSSTRQTPRST